RVIFNPLNLDSLARTVHHFGFAFKAMAKLSRLTEPIVSIPLDQIKRVEPIGQLSLLSASKVIITLRDGSHYEFFFVVSHWSLKIRPQKEEQINVSLYKANVCFITWWY